MKPVSTSETLPSVGMEVIENPIPAVDLGFVDNVVARVGRTPDAVIPILQAIQEHYGYLPPLALQRIGETTEITPAAISGVSTFYDIRSPATSPARACISRSSTAGWGTRPRRCDEGICAIIGLP